MVSLLLCGLQSPINTGMILRVAETYRTPVFVLDQHGLFANTEKLQTIRDFSCGALSRAAPTVFATLSDGFLQGRRLIATSSSPQSQTMRAFQWEARDLIALGNEYDGLSDDFVAGASEQLYIAMPDGSAPKPQSSNPIDPTRQRPVRNDGSPSLNVAIAAGIICHAAYGYSKLS